jgi:diguanylate cyclase (GGDEF)-like protein
MEQILEFYENMNEIVYVSDMDNYEVIYMNRKARELYGIVSQEELKGRKCYEMLQGSSAPCAICTNSKLKYGEFVEWKYYNPIAEKPFMLKDTMIKLGGRRCRVELAIDLSEQEHQKKLINKYINNEAIINEALHLSLSSTVPDESINILLEYTGKSLKCDRIYVFEEQEGWVFSNTYEWCARGVSCQKNNLQNIPAFDVRMWLERFNNNKNVIITNLEDEKESDPVMYDYLFPQEIASLVVSPLVYNNKIIGFYGVDNPPDELIENISTLFMIMGHFIVSLIRRRDLFKRLENISLHDQLTGLGNRYALDDYIETMDKSRSLGIVSFDVMGLKRINDTMGHQAGDKLLIKSSRLLRDIFEEYSLFRIGGDEFLAICTGVTEEEIQEKIRLFHISMKEKSFLLAVGYAWRSNGKVNMDKLFAEADESMYREKRDYYSMMNRDK